MNKQIEHEIKNIFDIEVEKEDREIFSFFFSPFILQSGREFNKQQIKQIQTFLDCRGNYFEVMKK